MSNQENISKIGRFLRRLKSVAVGVIVAVLIAILGVIPLMFPVMWFLHWVNGGLSSIQGPVGSFLSVPLGAMFGWVYVRGSCSESAAWRRRVRWLAWGTVTLLLIGNLLVGGFLLVRQYFGNA